MRSKQDLFEQLIALQIPCAPVRDLTEVVSDPHLHERRALENVSHPLYGPMVLPNSPLRFGVQEPLPIQASRELGADNAEIYEGWLGLSRDEVQRMEREDVI
jgi:formyl-CoA transferase